MRVTLFALLAACAPEAPAIDGGAAALVAAPLGLAAGPLTPGQPFTLTASGAAPGDTVHFAASDALGRHRCPPWMKGACGDLARPVLLGKVTAGRGGAAALDVPAPTSLVPGDVWLFQAIAIGPTTGLGSPVVRVVVEAPRDCGTIVADFEAEAEAIRACRLDSDCGTVLNGTSCGCTRDWVARVGVDTTAFYDLLAEASSSCGYALGSTCDCPNARGYACVASTCTWNYLP